MTPVEDVLARFRHRYLIIGSGALRLHGIDWEEGDLDIWLDPNLSDEDWQAAVDDAADSLKRPWRERRTRRFGWSACINSHRLLATAGRDA